jgi:hypothetical protein
VKKRRKAKAKRSTEPFIRGPIPANWTWRAASLPGRAMAVAMYIRYLAGFRQARTVWLATFHLEKRAGIPRWTFRRGLRELERAGLVSVVIQRGSSQIRVTILELKEPEQESESTKKESERVKMSAGVAGEDRTAWSAAVVGY